MEKNFEVFYTCEDCGEQFTYMYGEKPECPKCTSTDCGDLMDDWEWW